MTTVPTDQLDDLTTLKMVVFLKTLQLVILDRFLDSLRTTDRAFCHASIAMTLPHKATDRPLTLTYFNSVGKPEP